MNLQVKYGTTRTVLLVGKYAFKIPATTEWKLFLCGLIGNIQEAQYSKHLADKKDIAKVLWSIPGGLLVCMQRANPITRDEFFQLNIHETDRFNMTERKQCCLGKIEGKIVAVDYGSFKTN